jgi:hypothetical protein
MQYKRIYLLIILFILSSCINKKLYLELKKEKSKSNFNLKMNGYYYFEEKDILVKNDFDSLNKHSDLLDPFIFYNDRTIKRCMVHDINMNEKDISVRHKSFTDYLKKVKKDWFNGYRSGWGHYKFKGDSIICRYFWHSARGLSVIFEQKGIILNDSSFVLNYIKSYEEKQEGTIKPTIYKFRYYPEKPDSTNPTFEF